MDNKQIIGVLTGYKGTSQAQAARLLHKTPQSLNITIRRNNVTLDDFIKLCTGMGMTIDIRDANNNNIILSLSATDGDRTDAASEPEHAADGARRQHGEPPRW